MYVISDIEASILGLVYEGPHYGYELEKVIEERGMRSWTEIGFSSIYYVLKKLEDKKLIESKIEPVEGSPSRRVYVITENGKKAMKVKVKSLLSNYKKAVSPFDLGVINIWLLKPEEALECLKLYSKSINEHISHLEDSLRKMDKSKTPYFVKTLFTRPLVHLKTEKSWVEQFSKEIEKQGGN